MSKTASMTSKHARLRLSRASAAGSVPALTADHPSYERELP